MLKAPAVGVGEDTCWSQRDGFDQLCFSGSLIFRISASGTSPWGEVLHNTPSASGCDAKTRFLEVHFVVWLGARIEEELARGYGTANLPDLSTRHLSL